jgi:hypothetical protein
MYHYYLNFLFLFPTGGEKLHRIAGGPTYPALLMLRLLVGSSDSDWVDRLSYPGYWHRIEQVYLSGCI